MGADGIIVATEGSCPVTPAVAKVSSGACDLIPMCEVKYTEDFLDAAKAHGWKILGTECNKAEGNKFVGLDELPIAGTVCLFYIESPR